MLADDPALRASDVLRRLQAQGYRSSERTVYLLVRSLRPSHHSGRAFPCARLAEDVRHLGLTAHQVATRTRLDPATVENIIDGRTLRPEKETVRQLLASLPISPAPYEPYIRAEFFRCPGCGGEREIEPGRLTAARRRVRGRTLRRTRDGGWVLFCNRCAPRRSGPKGLERANRRNFRRAGRGGVSIYKARRREREAYKARLEMVWGGPEKVEQRRRRFGTTIAKQLKSEKHRRGIGRGQVVQPLEPHLLHTCPADGFLVYGPNTLHPAPYCRLYWVRPPGTRSIKLPAPLSGPDHLRLARGVHFLMLRRLGWSLDDIAHGPRHKPKQFARWLKWHAAWRLDGELDRSTVLRQSEDARARLPGRWALMFPERRRFKGGPDRRQELMPLPDEIARLCDRGQRDDIVQRLSAIEMPAELIAELTGLPLWRASNVVTRLRHRQLTASGSTVIEAPTVAKILELYLADLRARGARAVRTIDAGTRWLRQALGDTPVTAELPAVLERWAVDQFGRAAAKKTVAQALSILKTALSFAWRSGWLVELPHTSIAGLVAAARQAADVARLEAHPDPPKRSPVKRRRASPRREHAEKVLAEFLSSGVRLASAVLAEAHARGITRDTLRLAKTRLGATVFRLALQGRTGGGHWFWAAPGLASGSARDLARNCMPAT